MLNHTSFQLINFLGITKVPLIGSEKCEVLWLSKRAKKIGIFDFKLFCLVMDFLWQNEEKFVNAHRNKQTNKQKKSKN